MGKQTRRKRKGGGNKTGAPSTTINSKEQGSVFLQRLRHSDPRTRHAALAALISTRLNPEELESGAGGIIDTPILQAVRERVMDSDLECAQAAAGCLANYVTFGKQTRMDITAGWTVVLVTRLQDCRDRLVDKNINEKNRKQWWALTVQCLHALCGLVESNEQALERLSPADASMTLDSVVVLLSLLEIGMQDLEQMATTADEQLEPMIQDVCIYTTRTLHSALDDNLELYRSWTAGWDLLGTVMQHGSMPMAARLHASGCLVAASHISQSQVIQHAVVTKALPLLIQCLEFYPEISKALLDKFLTTLAKFNEEQADEKVENDVIRTVTERKEPARNIARRQKEMKEHKKQQGNEIDKEVDDEMQDDETNNQILRDHENRREAMENARRAWHNSLLPLQLALEITANLTSVGPSQPVMDEHDMVLMDEADWGPDQEAQLIEGQSQQAAEVSAFDLSLMHSIVASGIPTRLVELLRLVCTPLMAKSVELPAEIKQELEEVQSKCGACLGNCFAEHFPWWGAKWKDLLVAFELSGATAIADTMTVALRSLSQVRKQIQPEDLELMLNFVDTQDTLIQRNMVEMLGILCSHETHPKQVNARVCSTLISLPIKYVAIVNEVLNALMDIYGNDDCHPDVFCSLQVLGYFQATIPVFKSLIQSERSKASKEEIEQWRESALNASRFVSYKKGQL